MADPPTITVGTQTAVGTVSYNGFSFPAPIKVTINVAPIYNADGRTVKYNEYTITIVSPIVAEGGTGTTDAVLNSLRPRLLAPGRDLVITGIGVGTLQIGPNYTADINYGPKPQPLSWSPLGSAQACLLTWTCKAWLRDCTTGGTGQKIDFSYSIATTIDERGYTTRVISGSLEVPVSRSGNSITYTADNNRPEIEQAFPALPGFHRVRNFVLSPDRRTLQFTYTDTQIRSDLPYPPGIVHCSARHRVHTALQGLGFQTWINTVSGNVEVMAGTSKALAWQQILLILAARRQASLGASPVPAPSADQPATKPAGFVIIESVDIDEDLFGHGINFSVSWRLSTSLTNFFKDSGLFSAYPSFSWQAWLDSANAAGINTSRGIADLRHSTGNDQLIECQNTSIGSLPGSSTTTVPSPDNSASLQSELPDATNSWLDFVCRVSLLQDGNEIVHKTLGSPEPGDGMVAIPLNPGIQTGTNAAVGTSQNTRIQRRGESKYTIVVTGFARRAGYKVPPFFANQIGNTTLILRHRDYTPYLEKNGGGVPIYAAKWRYEYDVLGIPNAELLANIQGGPANPSAFAQ